MNTVNQYYDNHPINEQEILDKLAADGVARDDIRPEDLSRYDQDHYGALDATDRLAEALQLAPGMSVLDVCSGMGGTSRYLASRYEAEVVGVDLVKSRVDGARNLTELVGLQDRVRYVLGDATDLRFEPGSFDRLVSQESFLHIADKKGLLAGCRDVLKDGGGLGFTDWIASENLSRDARERFADSFAVKRIAGLDEYRTALEDVGFSDVSATDLSVEWREILGERLEMYRSLKEEAVDQFGAENFDGFISTYEFFISLIDAGSLGGGRFIAWKHS